MGEFQNREIAMQVLGDIQKRRNESGKGYFGLIRPDLQVYVAHLARRGFRESGGGMEFSKFLEDLTFGWLAKHEAFDKLAEAEGYLKLTTDLSLGRLNVSRLAMLSRSSSMILVSEGAFDRRGQGARLDYRVIPLRGGLSESFEEQGIYLGEIPRVGERVIIDSSRRVSGKGTSPLISAYYLESPESGDDLSSSMTEAFQTINESVHGA